MMNDTVREELQTKIAVSAKLRRPVGVPRAKVEPQPQKAEPGISPKAPAKSITTELTAQKTSPTLVGFNAKNPTIPDWRLKVQNAVRQKRVSANGNSIGDGAGASFEKQLVTNGANALQPEFIEVAQLEPQPRYEDPRVANALRRINESRSTFMSEAAKPQARPARPGKSFPFDVVEREMGSTSDRSERASSKASVNVPPKPRLVTTTTSPRKYDTNKLPPLAAPNVDVISSFEIPVEIPEEAPAPEPRSTTGPVSKAPFMPQEQHVEADHESETDEFDDLAPFAVRFNAGLFDLIIGGSVSLVLLSPLAFFGGNWMSFAGLLTLAASCSIVMFIYMTISLGLFGKTIGMRMFSLELIDADENEYPTFHQAAVSSATYLLTLPLFGIGFITMFFNDEKRAAHDLLSGTIIVTEF